MAVRVNVEGALAIHDYATQDDDLVFRFVFSGSSGGQPHWCEKRQQGPPPGHHHRSHRTISSCPAQPAERLRAGFKIYLLDKTTNFIRMFSWSSLQMTVHRTSYSPGSAGAVSANSCVPGFSSRFQPLTLLRSFARSRV